MINDLRSITPDKNHIIEMIHFLLHFSAILGEQGLKKSDAKRLREIRDSSMDVNEKVDYIIYYWDKLSKRKTIKVDNEAFSRFKDDYAYIRKKILDGISNWSVDDFGPFTKAGVVSDIDHIDDMFALIPPVAIGGSKSACSAVVKDRSHAESALRKVLDQFRGYPSVKFSTPKYITTSWMAMSNNLDTFIDPKKVSRVRTSRSKAMAQTLSVIHRWSDACF